MITIERSDCRPLSLKQAADMLQALGHPVRLQIIDALTSGSSGVGALVDYVGLPQPMVSRHLAILRSAGVLSVEQHGRERTYRVARCYAEPLLEVLFPVSRDSNGMTA